MTSASVLEICAGAGGQALGLEWSGFQSAAAVEIDPDACQTLRVNRPAWDVRQCDVADFNARPFAGVDLIAGGVPCPPFSIAGKQLGREDQRDLFPHALRLVEQARPRAVLIENVRGLASAKFALYRAGIVSQLESMKYAVFWRLLNASEYGVPQLRPRFVLVALEPEAASHFVWPDPSYTRGSVGDSLLDLMARDGWGGASAWAKAANRIAPTLVGGSRKHGGPDLGPSRARAEWLTMRVDGRGIADAPPNTDSPVHIIPRLTLEMVARLQGFPDEWRFLGSKTSRYRQIGNAFPPPVAAAVGGSILAALRGTVATPRYQSQTRFGASPQVLLA